MIPARYDGIADWYDGQSDSGYGETVAGLLAPGTGPCLDLGCGTGHYFAAVRSTGRWVVGLDLSADQLRVARQRGRDLVRADALALPFPDGVFTGATAIWVSTDVDDLHAVLGEVARVLRPGGRLVLLGVHPCFNGPGIEGRARRLLHRPPYLPGSSPPLGCAVVGAGRDPPSRRRHASRPADGVVRRRPRLQAPHRAGGGAWGEADPGRPGDQRPQSRSACGADPRFTLGYRVALI